MSEEGMKRFDGALNGAVERTTKNSTESSVVPPHIQPPTAKLLWTRPVQIEPSCVLVFSRPDASRYN